MFFTMLERWLVVSTLWWLVPGMLLRFDFGAGGWVPLDFWWGGVIGIYLVKKLLIDRQWLSYPLFWPGAAFITWSFFTLIWQGSDLLPLERILSGAYLVQWIWWWIWGYLVFSVVRVAEHRAFLIKHLEWILALVLVGGLIQFQWFPNLGSWSVEGGWDPHSGRLFGTWLDPNFYRGIFSTERAGAVGMVLLESIGRAQNFPRNFVFAFDRGGVFDLFAQWILSFSDWITFILGASYAVDDRDQCAGTDGRGVF